MLDEQGHLECEIEELRLEIKDNAERIDKLCDTLKQNNTKLRKLKEMNHRTPYKPQVEYYDEQTVIINGVQYQRVEPPKPPTLYEVLYDKGDMYSSVCDTVVEIVKEWMPDKVMLDEEEPLSVMMDYRTGWNNCIKYLKENLK